MLLILINLEMLDLECYSIKILESLYNISAVLDACIVEVVWQSNRKVSTE